MPFSEATLDAELATDPKGLGYATMVDDNGTHHVGLVTEALNTPGLSSETTFADRVATEDLAAGIVRTEYDALAAPAKAYLTDVVLAAPWVVTGSANMRSNLAALFPAGSQSRANLTAMASRPASRSELLFGGGYQATVYEVEQAFYRLGWWPSDG